jgi:hypothetical protein
MPQGSSRATSPTLAIERSGELFLHNYSLDSVPSADNSHDRMVSVRQDFEPEWLFLAAEMDTLGLENIK